MTKQITQCQHHYCKTQIPDLLVANELIFLIIISVQSRSAEICNSKSEVQLLASNKRPPGAEWSHTESIKAGHSSDPKRKKDCRGECKKLCLSIWRSCVSFASMVLSGFNIGCKCWGYKNLPDFGPNVSIERATFLNGWCVAEWFSFGMPL